MGHTVMQSGQIDQGKTADGRVRSRAESEPGRRVWGARASEDEVREVAEPLDAVDWRVLRVLSEGSRIGMLELSRRAEVARGTAQAHVDRLLSNGVITSFSPHLDVRAMGYGVLAFTTIDIAQGRLGDVVAHLREVPEVLEAHATTGW